MTLDAKHTIRFTMHDTGLPTSKPPVGLALVGEWSLRSPHQLSAVRARLTACLEHEDDPGGSGVGETPENVVLIASELATNALQHGQPPTVVRLLSDGDQLLLEVVDHDRAGRPVYAGDRVPGDGGIGLHLARTLSSEVGWFRDQTSKTVWATFPA